MGLIAVIYAPKTEVTEGSTDEGGNVSGASY